MNKTQIIIAAIIFILGFAGGAFWFRGCMEKPCPEIEIAERVIVDSSVATLRVDTLWRTMGMQYIRVPGDTVFRTDEESKRRAGELQAEIMRLLAEKSVDLIATDTLLTDRYRLAMMFRYHDNSFNGTTLDLYERPVETQAVTFWDRFGLGIGGGVYIGTRGADIGIGIMCYFSLIQ